ncbi:MAG: universal stress protein [Planctomycetota bacterium]
MQQHIQLIVGLGLAPGGQLHGFGPGTRAALAAAGAVARRAPGVHVTLIHATGREGESWPPRTGGVGAAREADPRAALLLDAEAAVADLIASGATAELVVTSGAAVPALSRRAQFTRADLLLIGRTEGVDGLARLGPTAQALVRTCPAPVWIVDSTHPITDGGFLADAHDTTGLALACRLARALRAPLHLATASTVPLASLPTCGERARAAHLQAARKRLATDALAAYRRIAGARVEPAVHVGFDDPRTFLHATAARLRPSALVLDPSRMTSTQQWPREAAETTTPVIVARPATFVSPYASSALYECH